MATLDPTIPIQRYRSHLNDPLYKYIEGLICILICVLAVSVTSYSIYEYSNVFEWA